ncbi:CidA/LrgA family protein [Halomonas coralii]|uniref:CidA/LrgA family protein n=1 Tax=Modicisalibacter sp. R2A 31.J TaxID=2831898 RepID=UPI001CCE3751|nr:CidA/LrgA family protein [Modicisalibacter sp. R2A 31.J]MBZ9557298.1 CidA/LrgA family protein [Modicisalibacter sp. R2A 31.J]
MIKHSRSLQRFRWTVGTTRAALGVAKTVLQVGLFSAIWLAIDTLRGYFGWSMPAGLIGLTLLAVGLFTGLVKRRWLQGGSSWLLAEMMLFFVPAMLVVIEYPDLIRYQGLRILAVIVSSTVCVIVVTALAVDRVHRLELCLARRRSSRVVSARR